MLDTIESLFAGLSNAGVLRAELRRLFAWLKERGITAVITGERGTDTLTRQGLEEYVSDCVIVLDHRVTDQISTRRLRIVKYRGSSHGTNEYPFLIDRRGIAVLPVTSLQLIHKATSAADLDRRRLARRDVRRQGIFPGQQRVAVGRRRNRQDDVWLRISSTPRAVAASAPSVFSSRSRPRSTRRNMRSVGLDLDRWVKKGLLQIHAARPTLYGLEFHLATMHREVDEARPSIVVVDPLSSFTGASFDEVSSMVMRLIDYLKRQDITALFTHLIPGSGTSQEVDVGVSSLIDTWILLRNSPPGEQGGRHLSILKSRGMAHSSERRSFELTDNGRCRSPPWTRPRSKHDGAGAGDKVRVRGTKKRAVPADEWILRLYVAGQSARSSAALRNLESDLRSSTWPAGTASK